MNSTTKVTKSTKAVLRALRGFFILLIASLCPAATAAQPAPTRFLVVPFENATGEPRLFWLGEGASVLLTDDLLALGASAFTRDDRLATFERLDAPPFASLSHATVIRLGQVIGATNVVIGSFELRGDELTVRARSVRLDAGRIAPEIVERGPLQELFAIYGRVARRLAPDSRVTFEEMEQVHPPVTAFEVYIKGLLADAPAIRLSFLSQAQKLAPTFYRSHLALWDVYTDRGDHLRAHAQARQVPATHRLAREAALLASISLMNMSRHQEAYDAFSALHRIAPDPFILNNLGVVQLRRPATAPGGKASSFFGQAADALPQDSDVLFNLGYAYHLERDFPAAVHWLREATRRAPMDGPAHYVLGLAMAASGSPAEGSRSRELGKRLSPELAEWDAKQPGGTAAPRGLERVKRTLSQRP
jgi:tetratricopeptide (TPR) repeat protein